MAVVSTSAASLLAQLDENDDYLQLNALQSLNAVVHEFWFQIASSIASVEAFYEDETFTHRKLAALLASKVFYYLRELDDALTYALGAGELFDITEQSDYVNTLLSRCVDKYIELRTEKKDGEEQPMDPRLENIIHRKFEQCHRDGAYAQAIGIALDARRLDKVEETIVRSNHSRPLIEYVIDVTRKLVVNRAFRDSALTLLVRMAEALPEKNWVNITQCFAFLDDAPRVANILATLLQGSEEDSMMACQICYDLFENEMQAFSLKVEEELDRLLASKLPKVAEKPPEPAAEAPAAAAEAPPAAEAEGEADSASRMEIDEAPSTSGRPEGAPTEAPTEQTNGGVHEPSATPEQKQLQERLERTHLIMRGNSSIKLYLEFMHRFNHSDSQILTDMKARIESRNSVCHGGLVFANAIMHSGTTIDTFLRDNLEWLGRATNWAKFGATAGLGVIHKGHLSQGRALMAPYLPSEGRQRGPYSEGGALFALGLIHANHGHDIRQFLLDSLKASQSEVTQHGACLGLGLAALGTNDEDILEDIKSFLYLDNAVSGEAAGIAMGLVAAGSASDKAAELLAYSHDTEHEKITRGVSLGLALIMYGREEGADTLIEQMTRDQDPIIRYGGMQTIGMAYRGTSNNGAIQKLLHHAVSDVSDDVRRAAVMNLGFVLIGNPEQCPKIVALLSDSYNPHVRYGAAMAMGIACSCTGEKAALSILKNLRGDTVDFVRQGAYIATALLLMQRPHKEAEVKIFRKELSEVVVDKHEETMARLGAIMASGILEAGGRNATVGLRSPSGFYKRTSCIGLMIFTQYWFWYPLAYFFSLALHPSAFIGVDKTLQVPNAELEAFGKPSFWEYPPSVKQADSNKADKVPQAVLSTTRKVQAVKAEKKKEKEALAKKTSAAADAQDVDMDKDQEAEEGAEGSGKAEESKTAPKAKAGKSAAAERLERTSSSLTKSSSEDDAVIPLKNPTRVVPEVATSIRFKKEMRYQLLDKHHVPFGIVVLRDTKPDQPVVLAGQEEGAVDNEGDALPPKPFSYNPTPQEASASQALLSLGGP